MPHKKAKLYAVDYYLFKYPTGSMKLFMIELYRLSVEITGFSIFLSCEWVGQLEARNEFLHDLSRWDNDRHPKPMTMKSLTQHDIFWCFLDQPSLLLYNIIVTSTTPTTQEHNQETTKQQRTTNQYRTIGFLWASIQKSIQLLSTLLSEYWRVLLWYPYYLMMMVIVCNNNIMISYRTIGYNIMFNTQPI